MNADDLTEFNEDSEMLWAPPEFHNEPEGSKHNPFVNYEVHDINKKLTVDERPQVIDLLKEFLVIFPVPSDRMGSTNILEHEIKTGNSWPVCEQICRFAPWQHEDIQKQAEEIFAL